MIQNHVIAVLAPDGLSGHFYTFGISDKLQVYLDEYRGKSRATKRHGWKVDAAWSRQTFGNKHRNTYQREEIGLPPELIAQTVQHFRALIQFKDQ